MRSICEMPVTIETADFLALELQEILKHADLSGAVSDELAEILSAIMECDEIRLIINP